MPLATDALFPLSDKEKAMKTFIVSAFAICLSVACSKNNILRNIEGKWELRESQGGIAGTIQYPAGNGILFQFGSNGQYESNAPGYPSRRGNYTIQKATNAADWIIQFQYVLNGQSFTEKDSVRFEKNQLIFLPKETCCDIPTVYYEKLLK